MGLATSLQCQDAGSTLSPSQWVKGPGTVAAAAQMATVAQIGSLTWELHMPWGSKKKKERKIKVKTSSYKISHVDIIYSIVNMVNNGVYLKIAKQVDLKSSLQKEKKFVTTYGDGC